MDYEQVVPGDKEPALPVPKNRRLETTVGRIIFNDALEEGMPFYNCDLSQKGLVRVVADTHELLGRAATIATLDSIKDLGFKYSTLSGLSFGVTDMRVPESKTKIVEAAQKSVDRVAKAFEEGSLTRLERYNQIIDIWIHARELVTAAMMTELKNDSRDAKGGYCKEGDPGATAYLNPILLMTQSGARGSVDQIRQLAGMRALMAKPSGEIIATPIKSNFREGLSVLEYLSSTQRA